MNTISPASGGEPVTQVIVREFAMSSLYFGGGPSPASMTTSAFKYSLNRLGINLRASDV